KRATADSAITASRMGCNTKSRMRARSPWCDLENFITGCNFLTCWGNRVPNSSCQAGQIFSYFAYMKTTTLPLNSMNRPRVRAFVLIPLLLACFALSPQAQATCQDACLTNNNTVQGDDALLNLTTGADNTALGFNALLADT